MRFPFLFFCRVLVQFKREFSFDDTMRLWEASSSFSREKPLMITSYAALSCHTFFFLKPDRSAGQPKRVLIIISLSPSPSSTTNGSRLSAGNWVLRKSFGRVYLTNHAKKSPDLCSRTSSRSLCLGPRPQFINDLSSDRRALKLEDVLSKAEAAMEDFYARPYDTETLERLIADPALRERNIFNDHLLSTLGDHSD